MEIGETWMKWAVMEGGTKVVKRMTMKFAGASGQSMAGAFAFTMMDGIVQLIGGYVGGRLRNQSILVTPGQILGGILFGIIATGMTVLGVIAFLYPDADAGVITFLVTMSIIPGALIDWQFFNHPLNSRQCLGVFAYLLAGYAILDFPGLARLANLPIWVWLGISSQFLAQSMKQ